MTEWFRLFGQKSAEWFGSPPAFVLAALSIAVWAALGPALAYSDTWQLIVNTLTSIVTFLMVFVIQSSQNRDTKAMNLKLDELIRTVGGARAGLLRLETLTEAELTALEDEFVKIRARSTQAGSIADRRPTA
jgi:low affinity Fe/Cu permease